MKTFRHSGDLGDIIYSLGIAYHFGGGDFYLANMPHVTRELTPKLYKTIAPLVADQPYIRKVARWQGERADIDFVPFRANYRRARPLAESHAIHVSTEYVDFSRPWLFVNANNHGRPVIGRSERYNNPVWEEIWPEVLHAYSKPIFIGTEKEHTIFQRKFGKVEYKKTRTLLDAARLIAGSSIYIGNQSSPFAIAEGLKHPRILEVDNGTLDCIYEGGDVRHILTMDHWRGVNKQQEKRPRQKLVLALQFHPDDQYEALALLELIADNEPVMRNDVEFAICARKDVNEPLVKQMRAIMQAKFKKVHVVWGKSPSIGWPAGPNALWVETMTRLCQKKREGKSEADAILTFEPDCVFLQRDWIDILTREWSNRPHGTLVVGHVQGLNHINGNAIFDIEALPKHECLYGADDTIAWDVYHGLLLMRLGYNTPEISQQYRVESISRHDIEGIRKQGRRPALFHGIKKNGAIAHVRSMFGI